MANQTPRTNINLPGFTFHAYGETYMSPMFGQGVAFDVYERQGGRTPELSKALKAQQQTLFEDWTIMTGRMDHGTTRVYVRVIA